MGLTRRDFFTLGLGAAAAIPLTPVPWKLLDDSAKWSQNWSWIPRPPQGERTVRFSSCTLCSAGCGIQACSVGRNVIGIAPLASHPVSRGVLCPYAFGAHQLPYHQARITQPLHHGTPARLDAVTAALTLGVKAGTIAILDERPGRAVSAAYQKIATRRGGFYIVAGRAESTTLEHLASRTGLQAANLGLALENVKTLVSFGAPVLESWATPGRVLTLWRDKRLTIVQVEAELSKTAALASHWFPSLDRAADTLRSLREQGPLLAVSGGGLPPSVEQTIAVFNQDSPGIVQRGGPLPIAATRLREVPDDSIDVLFIDHGPLGGSLSVDSLRPKLRRNGIIISLSPYRAGVAALADYVIPTPAFAEYFDEAPTPWDAVVPSYASAPALLDPPAGAVHPLEFVRRVTGAGSEIQPPEALIRTRVDQLHAARQGEVFIFADRTTKPVTEFKSAADLWKVFAAGACWIDTQAKSTPVPSRPLSGDLPLSITCLSHRSAVAPPLFTKLDQESRLGRAYV